MDNNNKSKYMIKIALEATAICATCYAFDYVWHNQYCNLIFQCGCTWPWAGGSKYCNIHNPNGPHCPWCESPKTHTQFLVDDRVMVVLMSLSYLYQRVRICKLKKNNWNPLSIHMTTTSKKQINYKTILDDEDMESGEQSISTPSHEAITSRQELCLYIFTPVLTFIIWGLFTGLIFFLFIAPTYPWFFIKWR